MHVERKAHHIQIAPEKKKHTHTHHNLIHGKISAKSEFLKV